MVHSILSKLIQDDRIEMFSESLSKMKGFEQRKYLDATISFVVNEYFKNESISKVDESIVKPTPLSGTAGLLSQIVKSNDVLKDHLVSILTRSTVPSLNYSLAVRRSVIAILSQDEGI